LQVKHQISLLFYKKKNQKKKKKKKKKKKRKKKKPKRMKLSSASGFGSATFFGWEAPDPQRFFGHTSSGSALLVTIFLRRFITSGLNKSSASDAAPKSR
tara:strand:+ start:558 stop:854 length:297 start_codon:yes stop_codon:yes gene_type:complete